MANINTDKNLANELKGPFNTYCDDIKDLKDIYEKAVYTRLGEIEERIAIFEEWKENDAYEWTNNYEKLYQSLLEEFHKYE
jgi:hypothetical protein